MASTGSDCMNKFKKDPKFLLKYCIYSLVFFTAGNISLYLLKGISFQIDFTPFSFMLPLLAILFCGLPSSILHNCAHGNIKPHLLNQITGEICGTFMLYGFKGFQVAHMYHHIFPDDPTMDPHPPRGYSFLRFVVAPIEATLVVIRRAYLQNFGDTEENRKNLSLQEKLFNIGIISRVVFMFLLLGPELFLLAYIPVYLTNIFVFAHINYATHIENENGDSEIINLDNNLYYKYVNKVSLGGYFHKSHHRNPQVLNPSTIVLKNEKRYITYVPKDGTITPPRKPLLHASFVNGLRGASYVK